LQEILAEELAADRERAADLLASAKAARIENATDAGKVVDLIAILRATERALEADRNQRREPHEDALLAVNGAYGAMLRPLSAARKTLDKMLTEWQAEHGPIPLTASIASVGSRRKPTWSIDDLPAALAWMLETHPGPLVQAMRTILGGAIHAAGVDAIERGEVQIPGVSILITKHAQVR
jgi:hypothetical protein